MENKVKGNPKDLQEMIALLMGLVTLQEKQVDIVAKCKTRDHNVEIVRDQVIK